MHEAMFYEKHSKKFLKCNLCPHNCHIEEGKVGACAVRKNIKGKLYSLVYNKQLGAQVDPIEKKPLFHFKPGSKIYSFCTGGCNFKCSFCQNWQSSQTTKGESGEIHGREITPKEIVKETIALNCNSIAATFVEPTIFFEYALDVFEEAKKHNLFTVFVSNGYINKEPIDELSKCLDAINIDLKSFNEDFYKEICGGKLQPVLDSIKHYHEKGVWVEITTLIIPKENDSDAELKKIAEFISSVDKNIPWHISRFHPDYQMQDKEHTSMKSLDKAYAIGKKAGLNYVYVGNVFGDKRENTYCPNCNKLLIERTHRNVKEINIKNNKCNFCDFEIKGYF